MTRWHQRKKHKRPVHIHLEPVHQSTQQQSSSRFKQSRKLLPKQSSHFCLTNFSLSKSIKMQFIKFVALVGLLAGGALAAPTDKPDKPQKPPKQQPPPPPPPTQNNACGNGASPFCCNGDGHGGYSSCYAYRTLTLNPCLHRTPPQKAIYFG